MVYLIAYVIEGEAGEWHRGLAEDISKKFGTWEIHKKIPSHITLCRPFDVSDVAPIKTILSQWVKEQSAPGNITLSGFGRFSDQVVFATTEVEPMVEEAVQDLRKKLSPLLPKEDFPNWHPHATLARLVAPETIEAIWAYVSGLEKPTFTVPFNTITLLRSLGDKAWAVEEMFPLFSNSRE